MVRAKEWIVCTVGPFPDVPTCDIQTDPPAHVLTTSIVVAALKIQPCFAAMPLAIMMTIGTARPIAHGQDTIRTVIP